MIDVTWVPRSRIAMSDESGIRRCCTRRTSGTRGRTCGHIKWQVDPEEGLPLEARSGLSEASDVAERKERRRVIEESPYDVLLDPVCQTCLGNALDKLSACKLDTRTHPDEPDNKTALRAMLTLVPSRFVEQSVCA